MRRRTHRRGRALRRSYGRSLGGNDSFAIEQSGGLFTVKLTRSMQLSSGKEIPAGKTLGTINERGTISVWRSAGSNPRGYSEAAKSLLNAAKSDLKSAGRIMAGARAREKAEEQSSGSFIVKVDGGPTFRAHDFLRARAMAETELLTRPIGTQAKFYRHSETGRTGNPWTEPFHVEETYEWSGQKRVGGPR